MRPDSSRSSLGKTIAPPITWPALVAGACLFLTGQAQAGSYQAIYTFGPPPDGAFLVAGLVSDPQGRLYGTTASGGAAGNGTVFRLTRPPETGPWTEEILHQFSALPKNTNADGIDPQASVTLGPDGTVYGTALGGGPNAEGTAFSLANAPNWPFTLLHAFQQNEGGFPNSALVFASNGLLYGTTPYISMRSYADTGTVFSVSPLGDRVEYRVAHSFGRPNDSSGPVGLTNVLPSEFNGFVGATVAARAGSGGGIFALQTRPDGAAAETPLYAFPYQSGASLYLPSSDPIAGANALAKAIYGCAQWGGTHNNGGIYQIMPNGTGGFAETDIYSFGSQPADPQAAGYGPCYVVQGKAGKLYGTSPSGGANDNGAFFELDPPASAGGPWTEKVDVSFDPNGTGGTGPQGAPLRMGNKYYGVTTTTVYELTP